MSLLAGPSARADVTHIVQRGHTIDAIAHRYRVTVKAIVDANKLADPAHLRPGQTLIIPGVDPPKKRAHPGDKRDEHHDEKRDERREERREGDHATAPSRLPAPSPDPPAADAHPHVESDTLHAARLGEDFLIRVKDARGHVPPSALKAFERMMRQGNATHPVDPRLVALVGIVSGHFGGKTIDVVSGYRAYKPTQYTAHSNHNLGRAIDFRVRGVGADALRDFCRTLRSAGCGYYPNSSFIHLDVRETKAYWVDRSRPGEAPKYDKPGMMADEGASDVPDDGTTAPEKTSETLGGSAQTHLESAGGDSSN